MYKRNTSLKMLLGLCCAVYLCMLSSCVDEDEYADNPRGNFEALWSAVDEHYCFFDYKKKAYGLDWDEVHERYSRQIDDHMTSVQVQLFEVLGNMLASCVTDTSTCMHRGTWHVTGRGTEDHPSNVSDTLLSRYLGTD